MKQVNQTMLNKAANLQQSKRTMLDYSQSTETLPHQVNGQPIQLSIPEWINTKLLEAFPHKWSHQELPSTWVQGISVMTVTEIRLSISKTCLTKKDKSKESWPPSLPDFIANGKEQIDYDAAYFRCLNKEPIGRVEQWVYEKAYYNIRSSSDEQARKLHKRFMNEAEELENRGKLKLDEEELLALPIHSVKNLNDLKREEFEASEAYNPFADRIKNLINKTKG